MIISPELAAKDCCDEQETHPDLLAKAIPDLPDEYEAGRLADLFKALADPTRVRIIAALLHTELCVDDLANLLDMSQSAISHQLRLLRNLHLVQFRRSGKHAFYRLVDDHVRDLFQRSREHLDC
ncbi:ArsR/SmtB family transcription factor [Methylotuvimicrobium buryatense]|uniref:ArsR family transcriptional regulator n=1 Tax=Methylotuvimicrobium buryatense TaxID=95641 RepID=A0A4P9UV38_METBY|nr:metalloregulator ArsR/SmtB family transcription factor [Methylotuvimicrobium buryatense]QCW84620.1 ArsR family transcriptional regulator [Methylotuvimicrobium buryatense]